MSKQTQATTTTTTTKKQQKPAPIRAQKMVATPEIDSLPEPMRTSSFQTSIQRLENPSLHRIQRQAIAAQIGNTQGNNHFQRKISGVPLHNAKPSKSAIAYTHHLMHSRKGLSIKKQLPTEHIPTTHVQRGLFGWIKKAATKVWGGIKGIAKSTWNAVKHVGSAAIRVAKRLGKGAVNLISKYGGKVVSFLDTWGGQAVGWIKQFGTQVIGWVRQWGSRAISWIKQFGTKVVRWVHRWGVQVILWIRAFGTRVITWLKEFGIQTVQWLWRVIKSGAALVWNWLINAPTRVARLIQHYGEVLPGLINWVWQGIKKLVTDPKGLGKWLLNGILSGTAWILRLLGKLFDVMGYGEKIELLWQIFKFNSRTLTAVEQSEAAKVLGNSVPYWQVRVDEASLIAKISSLFVGGDNAVTLFHTINFPKQISAAPGNDDMAWLIHELVHVAQMESVGSQYTGEAVYAQQFGDGYDYGPPANLTLKNFNEFNREQQGDIAHDYYKGVLYGPYTNKFGHLINPSHSSLYQHIIRQLKQGNL